MKWERGISDQGIENLKKMGQIDEDVDEGRTAEKLWEKINSISEDIGSMFQVDAYGTIGMPAEWEKVDVGLTQAMDALSDIINSHE